MDQQNIQINFSTIGLFKLIVIGVAGYFLYLIRDVVVLLFTGIIFAAALDPIVTRFERRGWPRALSLSLIYLITFCALAAALFLVVPLLVEQFGNLSVALPQFLDSVKTLPFASSFSGTGLATQSVSAFKDSFINGFDLLSTFSTSISAGFTAFLFLIITFYLVMAEKDLRSLLTYFFPTRYHDSVNQLFTRVQLKLGFWLRGQLIVMLAVGLANFLALSLIGVPNALVLGLFSGVFEIVPYFGPIIGALPGVILAASISPVKGLIAIGSYLLIQQLQNIFLIPRLQGKNAGLSPLLIIIAVLIGARLDGVFGTLLAVPVATVISTILNDYLLEKWPKPNN